MIDINIPVPVTLRNLERNFGKKSWRGDLAKALKLDRTAELTFNAYKLIENLHLKQITNYITAKSAS